MYIFGSSTQLQTHVETEDKYTLLKEVRLEKLLELQGMRFIGLSWGKPLFYVDWI